MVGLCLINERWPAASIDDVVLSVVPYVEWIADHNYHLWLLAYLPIALWLWRIDRAAFIHFLYVGGVVSLVRGVTIILTPLGPVDGHDINAGLDSAVLFQAWLSIINPVSALTGDAVHLHLTKDLFFSGHTATTFLLWLYCRGRSKLGWIAFGAHIFVVTVVFLAHLHYTVDVIGAWLVTYGIYWAGYKLAPRTGGKPA